MSALVLGEFQTEAELVAAVTRLRAEGFEGLDAHTPIPIDGLSDALGLPPSRVTWVALTCGLGGAGLGYLVQWWCNAVDWPLNIGGRPPHSALSFIPITFETGVLFTGISIVAALIILFGFPWISHPVFRLPAFASASIDRFWVSVPTLAAEPRAQAIATLRHLGASEVAVVEEDAL